MDFLKEILFFLKARKKIWLLPIFVIIILLGGLILLAQVSVISPFIYTIF